MLVSLSPGQKITGLCVILAVLIAAFILAFQLLIEPITGVADNGDFHRVTHPLGLYSTSDSYEDRYFNYLERYWQFGPHESRGFFSSQQVLILLGLGLNSLVMKSAFFDIVSMGLVHSFLLLPAIALLTFTLINRLGKFRGLIILALIFIIFLDSGYITYFNTFYSEAIAILSLFYLATASITLLNQELPKRARVSLLIIFYLFALLFITSKNQFALLAPFLAWIGYRLGVSVLKAQESRWIIALSVTLLASMSVYFILGVPKQYAQFNRFNSVFSGILVSSPDPHTDLVEMGIDPKFATLAGKDYWEVDPDFILSEDFQIAFFDKVTFFDIFKQYLRHPEYFADQILRAVQSSVFLASDELGHYEKTAGFPPITHSHKFNLWSNLRSNQIFGSVPLTAIFYLLNLLAVAVKRFRIDKTQVNFIETEIHLCLLLASLIIFFAALMGDGQNEIIKHLLLFNFLRDVCLIILVAQLLWLGENIRIALPLQSLGTNKTKL